MSTSCKHCSERHIKKAPVVRSYAERFTVNECEITLVHKTKKTIKHTDIYNEKNKISYSNQLISAHRKKNMESSKNDEKLICNEFTTASPTLLLPLSSSSSSSSSSKIISSVTTLASIQMPTKSTMVDQQCLCGECKSHIRQNTCSTCNNINRIQILSSVILQQYPFPNSSSSSSSSLSTPPPPPPPPEIESSKLLQLRRRQDDKQKNSLIHRKKENAFHQHHHNHNNNNHNTDCNVTNIKKYSNYINNNINNTNININNTNKNNINSNNNNCCNKNDNNNNNNNNKNNSIVQSCKYYYKIFMKKQSTIFMSTKTTTRAIMNIKLFIIYALLFLFTFRGVMADITAISPFNRTTTTTAIQTNNTIIESSRSGICTSIDIRNDPIQMNFLKGCRVIEGFLTISLIERVKENYDNYSFPLLTEITDYFLLFRIDGLKSLSKLFPNLSVIRGNSLFNDYAFVIYEMPNMEDIGLKSLTKIVRGNIRIEKNPQLCFVDTLDWSRILNYNTTGNFIRENKLKNECPVCISTAKSDSNSHSSDEIPSIKCPPSSVNDQQGLCWNRFTCQKICPAKCGNRSCNDNGECCDDSCIGSCSGSASNCTVCHGTRDGTKCVEKCPKDRYNYANSRCVDAIECRKIQKPYRMRGIIETLDYPFVPFDGNCALDCPPQYYVTGESGARFCVKCVGLCRKDCAPININSISAIQLIQGCTRITGSLNIQIRSQGQHNVVKELENALRDLEVIEGSLKIVRSYPIISLSFFKNLKIIRGNVLETDRYAVYIMDNQNLQSLFTQNVTIERGKLFFHFNPKLCYNNIERLRPFVHDLKNSTKFAIEDVAISSNGDKISCNVTLLETTVVRIVETAAVIALKKMQYEDERTLLGYVLFYIVAPYRNVSMYDGRDACGGDGWRVEDVLNDNRENEHVHFIITHLKPFTQYGFYVKTYTIASEPYGGQSPIQYFKTPASKPSPVTDISTVSVTSNSMHIKWGPPKQPNGELTSYIITAEYATQNMELLEKRDYCANGITPEVVDVAEPTVVEPKKPEVVDCNCEENDNRDELTDEEAEHLIAFENEIQNFIYIRRPSFPAQSERRRKRNIYSQLSNSNSSLITTPLITNVDHQDDEDDYFYNDQSYTMTDNSTNSNINASNTISGNSISGSTPSSSVANTGLLPNKNNVVTSETGIASQLFPLDQKPVVSTTLNISKILLKDEYGYYKYFYSQVNTSVNSFVLSDLKHYTLYKISIIACHSGTDNEIENCSNDVYIHQKTSKIDNADDVKSLSVSKLASSNHSSSSIAVRWPIPESPNGIIVNFLIRYVRWQDGAEHQYQEICVTRKKDDEKEIEYIIPRMDNGNISFHVIAVSLAGQGKTSPIAYVIINDSESSNHTQLILGLTITILVISFILICLYHRKKHLVPVSDLKLIASVNPEYISMQYQADEWEVPREKIIQLCELGQGSFGMVYEGIAKNLKRDGEELRCAIKTANENATDRERANFLKEATTMKGFNTHHVVRLLGVVSRGQPTLVVMELMVHGDLKGYLRAHRPEAEEQSQEMYLRDDIEQQQLQPPTLKRILQMAIEIADGMSYLAAKKFVHRDLAARNCMVSEDLTVKIGDFGMTRDVYETDYYRKGTKGLLPVRWMSPESLKDGVFSSSSDVFSYGVVLWEMATLASQPYQGLSNDQVVRYVIDGGVMERPENCPDKLYKMMIKTWQHRPSARPSFLDIVQSLLDDVNPNFRQVSFFHSPAGQSLLEQQRNKNIPVDSRTPLRAEEEDFNVEIDDTYLAPNNSNLPHDDDEPSHSPLR